MSHKLDCTEKAYKIMMEATTWKKPKRMTPKRQKYINILWPQWKIYRDALKKLTLNLILKLHQVYVHTVIQLQVLFQLLMINIDV